MAEFTDKKYLDLAGLTAYDAKIKEYVGAKAAELDAQVLQDAKDYCDAKDTLFEPAGALTSAKAYTEEQVATVNATVASVKTTAEQGVTDAAAAKKAADDAQATADANTDLIEALDAYVGDIPEGYEEQTNIVAYINKKAEETLSAASGGSTESAASVKAALDTEIARAKAAEEANATAAANAQSAAEAVDARVDVLVGEDAGKSVRTIANEELAAQLIAEGAAESLDTLQEIAAWIQAHPNDASAMNKAIEDLEGLVGTLPEGVTATTIVGYIQEAVAAEKSRAEGVESGFESRIAALEAEVGSEEGTIAEQISAAVAAEAELRVAADDAIKNRLDDLEAIDHSHANQAELDKIAEGDKDKWDAAAEQAHTHENADELAKVADGDVEKWNAALQVADIATGSANGTIAVKGADVAVKGLGGAAYTEASAYDAAGAADGALASAKSYTDVEVAALNDSFKVITTTEINQLFAVAE